jgi:hypothetical protein
VPHSSLLSAEWWRDSVFLPTSSRPAGPPKFWSAIDTLSQPARMAAMDQSTYLKRFYSIVGIGACVLIVLVWVFMKGGLSPRGFVLAILIWWIIMFASFFSLIRLRQRSVGDIRRRQIAGGVPEERVDQDRCVSNIRSMKRLIVAFAVLFGYGMLATRGDPPLPRVVGATVDTLFLAVCVHSLIRSKKRLKVLRADSATSPQI